MRYWISRRTDNIRSGADGSFDRHRLQASGVVGMSAAIELERSLDCALRAMTLQPAGCAVEEIGTATDLPPEEEALVASAVASRRREFAAGRRCARRALAMIGGPQTAIPIGQLHQPIWPAGYRGAISHDGRFAAAVACFDTDVAPRLSVDLIDRPDLAPYLDIVGLVSAPGEPWGALHDARRAARVFSAKEAAIKILSPWIGDYVEFSRLEATTNNLGFRVTLIGHRLSVFVRVLELDGVILSVGIADMPITNRFELC
jgi:4'-phosphopantetheinyl transferase EntD